MAAAITVTPTEVQVGDAVTIDLTGFLPLTECRVEVPEYGFQVEGTTDASGQWDGTDLADKATGTLTIASAQNAIADETVVLGDITYVWKASVTTTANEVKIGADANASLDNLKAAINGSGGANYGSLTVANPLIGAGARGTRTLVVFARTGGTAGNALASTETMTQGSFVATTLEDTGAAATGVNPLVFTPTRVEPFTINATDGTSTVTKTVPVWSK